MTGIPAYNDWLTKQNTVNSLKKKACLKSYVNENNQNNFHVKLNLRMMSIEKEEENTKNASDLHPS